MRNVKASATLPRLRPRRLVSASIIACVMLTCPVPAQAQSPGTRIEALGLESMKVGRVTTLFVPNDRARAKQLGELSEAAAAFFQRELGVSFEFRLAVLGPKQWFSPHGGPGIPYGIPWCSVAEGLMVVPASLKEGALISGLTDQENRRTVDFVTLHELGHLAVKRYIHPASAREELPVPWFEELTATYFGYAFISAFDREWAASAKKPWIAYVDGYTPRKLSLDWSFMRDLPPAELSATYGWYQNSLNLRVADVYAERGLAFIRELREKLPLRDMDAWTTESLLGHLEQIAPGFQRWAARFQKGGVVASNVVHASSTT